MRLLRCRGRWSAGERARKAVAAVWPQSVWVAAVLAGGFVAAWPAGQGDGVRVWAAEPATQSPASTSSDDDGEFARKADIMHGSRWQQAITELGNWLTTQVIYSPAEVQRIKVRFNERVSAMSSYELEYLIDSISLKLDLLKTPEARDAKAWLGEYLSAMSDARRAQELREIPNVLEMNAAQLWEEIQRIDRKRAALQNRQQGFESQRGTQVDRVAANRQASAAAAQAAAARVRSAPAHSPYRQGGGSPPFSDIQPRRATVTVGPMGAMISM